MNNTNKAIVGIAFVIAMAALFYVAYAHHLADNGGLGYISTLLAVATIYFLRWLSPDVMANIKALQETEKNRSYFVWSGALLVGGAFTWIVILVELGSHDVELILWPFIIMFCMGWLALLRGSPWMKRNGIFLSAIGVVALIAGIVWLTEINRLPVKPGLSNDPRLLFLFAGMVAAGMAAMTPIFLMIVRSSDFFNYTDRRS